MEENAQTKEPAVVTPETDYKALYEQTLKRAESAEAEATKQKGLKDNYAKENAEYKRKAEAQMTDDEKKAKEWQELLDGKAELEAKVARFELEKQFVANGFSAEETDKLINGNFAAKDLADIIKARCDEAVKSAQAEGIKKSTPDSLLGNGNTNTNTSYAETLAKKSFANGDELAKIKQLYK